MHCNKNIHKYIYQYKRIKNYIQTDKCYNKTISLTLSEWQQRNMYLCAVFFSLFSFIFSILISGDTITCLWMQMSRPHSTSKYYIIHNTHIKYFCDIIYSLFYSLYSIVYTALIIMKKIHSYTAIQRNKYFQIRWFRHILWQLFAKCRTSIKWSEIFHNLDKKK